MKNFSSDFNKISSDTHQIYEVDVAKCENILRDFDNIVDSSTRKDDSGYPHLLINQSSNSDFSAIASSKQTIGAVICS